MDLETYLKTNDIRVEVFAYDLKKSASCIWHYLAGRRKPTKKTAMLIEKKTKGAVTVQELLGNTCQKK